jgi:receptor-type tyrosine-protein phosphatase A
MSQVCIVREITQYHFTDWPDFGVPEDASSMLKFVRRVRGATSPTHGPVVIHCSAGVGRTGTFIAIDVMLQKMAAKESLNVQEFVCRMRAQRAYMIQTSVRDYVSYSKHLLVASIIILNHRISLNYPFVFNR